MKKGLQNAYAENFKGKALDVFCVSNALYEKYSRKEQSGTIPKMVATGWIPALRKFCYSMSIESKFRDAKHLLRTTLPGLLASISVHSEREPSLQGAPKRSVKLDLPKVNGIKDSVRHSYTTLLRLVLTFHGEFARYCGDRESVLVQFQSNFLVKSISSRPYT